MKKEKKNRTHKVLSILGIILGSLILVAFVTCIVLELVLEPDSPFVLWAKENVWDVTAFPEAFQTHVKVLIHCAILITVVIALSSLLRLIFRKAMKQSNRAKTVITLLDGIIK